MDYADKYIRRMEGKGFDFRDATFNKAKIIRDKQIANSPTRSDVYVNNNKTISCCLATDIDSFKKRRFVFTSDTVVDIGSYIKKDEYTYLATKRDTNDVNPTVIAEVCNSTFTIKEPDIEVEIDTDMLGRPIYEIIEGKTTEIACIVDMNTASVSIADTNRPINLLDNKVYIKIPYIESHSLKYGETFDSHGITYRIIRINPTNVVNGIGYLEITGELIEEVNHDES